MTVCTVRSAKGHLYDIVFDDGQGGSIDKTVWEHSGLTQGSILEEEEWAELQTRSEAYRAREKALYYLSLRDYGGGELVSKLRRAGIERTVAEDTVARLAESGLIDDVRYAAALSRDMSTRKLYPKRRIAMALREKGFSACVIEEVLEELPLEEEQQALEMLKKKGYNGDDSPQKRDKALAMLARYGFSYAASKRALALLEELCDEDDD